MTFLQWSDKYELKVRVIDSDHRALFDIINALHEEIEKGAGESVIGGTLTALIHYADEHFAREELYMEQGGYPHAREHIAEHQELTKTVHTIKERYDDDPATVDGADLVEFLKVWLTDHILEKDMKLGPYLRGEKANQRSEKRKRSRPPGGVGPVRTVFVRVPVDKASLAPRFARALRIGGDLGKKLEELLGEDEETDAAPNS